MMGILAGIWVIGFPWVTACEEAGSALPEEGHEVTKDTVGNEGGPILGRHHATQGTKLLAGYEVRKFPHN